MRQSQGKNPDRKTAEFIEQSAWICQNHAMLILIDGYNLIRQSEYPCGVMNGKSLEEGRRALIAKLIEYDKKTRTQNYRGFRWLEKRFSG